MMLAMLLATASAEEGQLVHAAVSGPMTVLRLDVRDEAGGQPPEWVFSLPADGYEGELSASMALGPVSDATYTVSEPDPAAPGSTRVVRTIELFDAGTSSLALEAVAGATPTTRFGLVAKAKRVCTYTYPGATTTCATWNYVDQNTQLP